MTPRPSRLSLEPLRHQQKALLVCQTCFPDTQIVWMLALIASLNQGFSITTILAGYYNPARISNPRNPRNPRNPPNPKISPLDDLAVRAPRPLNASLQPHYPTQQRLTSTTPRLSHTAQQFRGNSGSLWLAAEAYSVSTLRRAPSLQLVIRHRVFPPPSTPSLQLAKRQLSPAHHDLTFHPQ
jgi:hypothetical protein